MKNRTFSAKARDKINFRLWDILANIVTRLALTFRIIQNFDYDNLYQYLTDKIISGIPITMLIKYLKPPPGKYGKCFERSYCISFAFREPENIQNRQFSKANNNCELVQANLLSLRLKFPNCKPEEQCHFWVEHANFVYDPTLLMRFPKKLYYLLYRPQDIQRFSPENIESNLHLGTIEDYCQNGKYRKDVEEIIPTIEKRAEEINNLSLFLDLRIYEDRIQLGKLYEKSRRNPQIMPNSNLA